MTAADPLAGAPDHVRADVPEWIARSLADSFGDDWVAEAQAMAGRPPLDLRVNTLKARAATGAESRWRAFIRSRRRTRPRGSALAAGPRDSRTPNVTTDEGYLKGWFEVQDQGSQLVAMLAGAKPGEQVLDLCAGAGGKTLAMAAAMENKGQIFAYDSDRGAARADLRPAEAQRRAQRPGARRRTRARSTTSSASSIASSSTRPAPARAPGAGSRREVEADAGAAGAARRRAAGAPRRGGAVP